MSPILDDRSLEFISHGPQQTQRLGSQLGQLLRGGEVICLEGSLGTGKTTLTQGIGRGWGAVHPMTSPTFVLVREHHRPTREQRLLHADFYRLQGAEEAWGLGLDDWMGDSNVVVVIEWPERALAFLPEERLWVRLEFWDEDRRRLVFSAQGSRYEALLQKFRRGTFGV